MKTYVNVPSKSNREIKFAKKPLFVAIFSVTDEKA
jgi:hypothetical protein